MEVTCQKCREPISYVGSLPRFCRHCGASLANTVVSDQATVAPTAPVGADFTPAEAGDLIAHYELVKLLGSGGMGVVWEAVDQQTGRRVALKMLAKNMIADDTSVKRFIREAQTAAQISHPKVTFIFGAGEHEETPFIAMELMPGRTLGDEICDKGPLSTTESVDAIVDVIDGLVAAHRLGLIHRDVKPSNCFLDTDNSVKIGDFGLSKSTLPSDLNLTQTGTFMGTPSYAAPEQVRGAELDQRTDIYSVGATLFHLLTGRPPFVGDAMSVTAQIISDPVKSVRIHNSEVPVDLDRIIAKTLDKNPAKRFQTLEQLKSAILPFSSNGTTLADFGKRLSAFMMDFLGVYVLMKVILMGIGAVLGMKYAGGNQDELIESLTPLMIGGDIATWIAVVGYFTICEWLWGRGFGKSLMQLSVVNQKGAKPNFGQAFLRAFAIPGCFGFTLLGSFYIDLFRPPPIDPASQLTTWLLIGFFFLTPTLICLSSMRTGNRFLGLHGKISQTKVVRVNKTDNRGMDIPLVQPRANTIKTLNFGPYTTFEILSENRCGHIYLGYDKQLERKVWLVVNENDLVPSSERINLSRVCRQRWLGGGNVDKSRWDAYEAVEGMPLQSLMGIKHRRTWPRYRRVLKEIAQELKTSLSDGTLPSRLTLPQIWMDRDGHAKLLDSPLVESVDDSNPFNENLESPVQNEEEQAVSLLQSLASLLLRTVVFPPEAQAYLRKLIAKPKVVSTLDETIEDVSKMKSVMEELTWDNRLGLFGMTFGIEMSLYWVISSAVFLITFSLSAIPDVWRFPVAVFVSMIPPAIAGFYFWGGPIFRFMEINVCNRQGALSSRFICAIRNVISWLPPIVFQGFLITMLLFSGSQVQGTEIEPTGFEPLNKENAPLILCVFAAGALSFLSMIGGSIFALLSPQKGLVDYLTRTFLIPR